MEHHGDCENNYNWCSWNIPQRIGTGTGRLDNKQANQVSSGITRHYVVAFVCLDFCLTRYQSAQFIRRTFTLTKTRVISVLNEIVDGIFKFIYQSDMSFFSSSTLKTWPYTKVFFKIVCNFI